MGSPFFRTLPLHDHGLEWIQSPAPLAHPLDDGTAVVLERSVDATCEKLDVDGAADRKLMGGVVDEGNGVDNDILGPPRLPRRPASVVLFGLPAIPPAPRLRG